jgi:hypothetical protein
MFLRESTMVSPSNPNVKLSKKRRSPGSGLRRMTGETKISQERKREGRGETPAVWGTADQVRSAEVIP